MMPLSRCTLLSRQRKLRKTNELRSGSERSSRQLQQEKNHPAQREKNRSAQQADLRVQDFIRVSQIHPVAERIRTYTNMVSRLTTEVAATISPASSPFPPMD